MSENVSLLVEPTEGEDVSRSISVLRLTLWIRLQEEEEEEEEDDDDDDADEDYTAPGGNSTAAGGSSQPAAQTEWTCPQCQTTFTDNDDYLGHVKLEHGKV